MPDTIDSLQIEIQANASAANKSISSLANQLYKLKGSLNGMNTGGLRSLSSSLQNFGTAMQAISSYKMPDFNRVAKGITALSTVNAGQITTAANALHQIGNSLNSLGNVSQSAGQIAELASAISKMGYKSATNAITNIPVLATAFKDLMTTLSTAPKVSQNVIDLANAMANLASNGANIATASKNASGSLNLFASSCSKTVKKTKSLSVVFGKLYATYWLLFRAFHKLSDAIDISSSLTEVQNVVSTTFGKMEYKMEDFAQTSIEQFGLSELAAKQYASRFQAMGAAMGINSSLITNATGNLSKLRGSYGELSDSLSDVSLNLTRLTADMASFYNVEQDVVAEDLAAIYTGQTRPLRAYGLDLTTATLKEWALKNGLDANIKAMSQAEKTMLRYQYVMANTAHVQGDFAKTNQTWANQIRILRQNFQRLATVIGNGFIAALRPLVVRVNQAMDAIIKSVQSVINALGKIFGWQMIIDTSGGNIADDAEDIADGYDDATDSAKKFKNFLLGIDELNVMPDQDDGGVGDGGIGGGGGFDANIIPGGIDFAPFESSIDNLFELGKKIGDTLIKMMKGIDWDHIYDQAKNFGKGLADFLNGLISPELFYQLGRTIANSINTAIYAALAFGENFDWKNFGSSIAAGINGFFENIDLIAAADTINTWANGILDALLEALDRVKWDEIGERIGDFLARIDFLTIFKKVAQVIWKALSGALKLTDSMFDAAPIETIILGIVGFSKLLKVKGVQTFTKAIGGLIKKLSTLSLITKNKGFLTGLTVTFEGLKAPIDRALASLETFHVSMTGGEGRVKSFNAGLAKLTENLSPLAKGLIGIGGGVAEFALISDAVHDIAAGTEHLGANIAELVGGLIAGAGALTLVLGFPGGIIAAGVIGLTGAVVGLGKAFNEALDNAQNARTEEFFKNEDGVPLSDVADNVADSLYNVSDGFKVITDKEKSLEEGRQTIESTWKEIDELKRAINEGTLSATDGAEKIKAAFEIISKAATDNLSTTESMIQDAFGENGLFRESADLVGVDAATYVSAVSGFTESVSQDLLRLQQELNNAEYGSEEWYAISEQIDNITRSVNDSISATEEYQNKLRLNGIDWSTVFPDGQFDATAFSNAVRPIIDATNEMHTAVDDAALTITNANTTLGSIATTTGYQSLATTADEVNGKMNEIVSTTKNMADEQGLQVFVDAQSQALSGLKNEIDEAIREYEGKNPLEKLWLRIFDINDAEDYAYDRANTYVEKNISPLNDAIQEAFENMGVEVEPFVQSATDSIMDSVFDKEYHFSDYSGGKTYYSLKDGWKDLFDQAAKDVGAELEGSDRWDSIIENDLGNAAKAVKDNQSTVTDAYHELGGYADEGYASGITDNSTIVTDATSGVIEDGIDAAAEAQKSHSPSEEYMNLGLYAVQGYADGIGNNAGIVIQSVQSLIQNAIGQFDGVPAQMYNIGADIGNSLANGISSALGNIRSAIKDISESITDVMDAVDDLNDKSKKSKGGKSGSRVPAFASGGFPEDGLFMANHGELVGSFSNGKTAVANNGQIIEGIKQGVYEAMASAMANGGNNVSVVLEGDTASFFSAIVRENNREIMRTGKSRLRN